jgi:ubiquinone/menaquinone biosynthesis C-methylase UbiE
MKFKNAFLEAYLNEAPVPLAFERAFECLILSQQEFPHPILDVGCGDGIFAKIVFDEKIDTGIDPLSYELESAKKYDMYDELIEAFGDNIPKPDSSYKTIFSNSVLEHIENLDPVLKEINRVLMPGGVFYATIPTNYFEKYSVISKLLNGIGLKSTALSYNTFFNKFWKHYHFYDKKSWTKKFESNGFKVVNVIEYGAPKDCLFNDFWVPFTIPNYFVKKLFNRFFLLKSLRKLYSPIWVMILKKRVKIYPGLKNGGLIFFALTKH